MLGEFDGKTAIITGASRGIGEATARELAKRGAAVILAARSRQAIDDIAAEINRAGGTAQALSCDVTRYADVEALVAHCVERHGRLHYLINNAGAIDPIARLGETDPDQWNQVVDINLKGVYNGLRAAIPVMEAAGAGVIVNISSGAATSPLEGWSHYCAAKAAALMLTRCADKEYRDKGIRVTGLSPGTVATGMQISIKASGINPVSQLDQSVHIPAEWVAGAIAWLLSDEASGYAGEDFLLRSDEGQRLLAGMNQS